VEPGFKFLVESTIRHIPCKYVSKWANCLSMDTNSLKAKVLKDVTAHCVTRFLIIAINTKTN